MVIENDLEDPRFAKKKEKEEMMKNKPGRVTWWLQQQMIPNLKRTETQRRTQWAAMEDSNDFSSSELSTITVEEHNRSKVLDEEV